MNFNLILELGCNHNGSIQKAKDMIKLAQIAGIKYVKLQKRDNDICIPKNKKNQEKVVPWRALPTTYYQYRQDLEFDKNEYNELFSYAQKNNIILFASVWDYNSAIFMKDFTDIVKIPSAKITDIPLLKKCKQFKFKLLSTGMSTEKEIETAIDILEPNVIFHCNANYPTSPEQLHLGYIKHLQRKYPNIEIGLSSHYEGIRDILIAMGMGVNWAEKHYTLDRNDFGSDQKASLSPRGLFELMDNIKELEKALDGDMDRMVYFGEEKKLKDLRG